MKLVDHITQAMFAAEEILNWNGQPCTFEIESLRLLEHYNSAVEVWQNHKPPETQVFEVGWAFGKSASEAAMLWLQDIALAIRSLQEHEVDDGILTEQAAFKLFREALLEWFEFNPSPREATAIRWKTNLQVSIELKTIELGVTIRDLFIAMDWSDDEISDSVKRFTKDRSRTAVSIGKEGNASMYRVFDIVENFDKYSPLSAKKKSQLIQRLQKVQREPD